MYESDPVKQAQKFHAAGASWLHIVDLDGAQSGTVKQQPLIAKLIKETSMKVQVGGGIRSTYDIEIMLEAGASRVIVGSLAAQTPDLVVEWLKKYGGDKLVLALDVRLSSSGIPEVLTDGWQTGSAQSLWNLLDHYRDTPLKTVICTDISRDGTLEGANGELYTKVRQVWSTLNIIASGGINSLDDLSILDADGVSGAIIGKALYEGHIDLAEAIAKFQKEAA
jgi:phosphoribosylformimino-5-aminoimidazole carboxamide ribotide isomerase